MDIPTDPAALEALERRLRQELEESSKQLMIVTAARQAIEARPATPSEMSLTELVLSVMEGQGAIEKAAIVDAVMALDPDAKPRSVGGTLNHLRAQGRVESPRRGYWVRLM